MYPFKSATVFIHFCTVWSSAIVACVETGFTGATFLGFAVPEDIGTGIVLSTSCGPMLESSISWAVGKNVGSGLNSRKETWCTVGPHSTKA